jgi:hypothetical protein
LQTAITMNAKMTRKACVDCGEYKAGSSIRILKRPPGVTRVLNDVVMPGPEANGR